MSFSKLNRVYNLKIAKLPSHQLMTNSTSRSPTPVSKLPITIDLRSRMHRIYDQGSLGSCTANALCE